MLDLLIGKLLIHRFASTFTVEEPAVDAVIFRQNTEGMYGGVEFYPLPESVYQALCLNPKMKPWKDKGLELKVREGEGGLDSPLYDLARFEGQRWQRPVIDPPATVVVAPVVILKRE